MTYSILPKLKAWLSRRPPHYPKPSSAAERRHHFSNFRLRAVARVTGTGVYDFDFTSGSNYWSPELKAIAGLPEDSGELSLEQMVGIAHPEDRERFMQQVEASLDCQGDGHFEDEYRLLRPDGTLRWVRVRGQTFFAAQAQERRVLGASGLVIDITRQKQAEERLRASEERYRTLFVNMTEAFALGEPIFDQQGNPVDYRFLEANDAFYVQSGIPRGNLGRPVKEYVPIVEQSWVDCYAGVATTGQAIRFENYNAGTRRYYDVYAFCPNPGQFAILFRDITKEKEAENRLRESEERFRLMADNIAQLVWMADEKGWAFWYNRRWYDYTGTTLEETQGWGWQKIHHPEHVERVVSRLRHCFETGEPWEDIFPLQGHDGRYRWFLSRATPQRDDSGRVLRWFGTHTDITERQNFEEELKKFKFFSDHANDGHLLGDMEGHIRYANRRLCERLGYTEQEMLRLRVQDIAPNTAEALVREMVERMRGDRVAPFESIRRCKNGSMYPVEVSITAQEVKGEWLVFSVSRDITERKRAEQALKDSERRLALALEASSSAVWEADVAADTICGDDQLFTMLGYAPGELATRTDWQALSYPDHQAAASEQLEEVIQGRRERCHIELRLPAKDGRWHWIIAHAMAAERDAGGRALRLVGTHTDISERKAAEAQIQALNAELENRVLERTAQLQRSNEALLQSNVELKHFTHATAHDLQTPLRSIASFTQLLQSEVQGRVNDQVDVWAATVVENTKRLQILIRDVLAYTRLEAQGRPFRRTDLRMLFDEVVSSLAMLIGETRAEVTCGPMPTLPVDRTQMAQVFQNLIENGIKYNRSQPPRVTVSGNFQKDQWVFSIADNGIGIDPRHYDRVFELFKRLHPYHQFPGTGIGLPLCRRIVEGHGGRMWIESRPGEGSTFYFSLPVDRSETS